DIENNPVGVLQMKINRLIYGESLNTVQRYLGIFILLGAILLPLMWYLLKIFVLDRIINISRQVGSINETNHFGKKIEDKGDDEIASMVTSINHMRKLITSSQHTLKHLAHYDALTDLPNRVLFYEMLTKAM